MQASTMEWIGAAVFAVAILHTFSTKFFEHLAHTRPAHAGLWHLLGEVEVVFGFWAMVLMACMFAIEGSPKALTYIDGRNFTEPMFVFAIMVIAATRPVLSLASICVGLLSRLLPLPGRAGRFLVIITVVPLLGSFITEPAAMTLGALMLSAGFFSQGISARLMYAALGTLFVNVSIGGTLTPFAAPPVLMVAAKWGWDLPFMMATFGWRSALAVLVNGGLLTLLFWRELSAMPRDDAQAADAAARIPWAITLLHLVFLAGVVVFAHHPPIFMGIFLLFMGVANAYPQHQDSRLLLREGLLVAFFLAGLVVLGGLQAWWLQPLLMSMNADAIYLGATALTAVTDNAALTYLGSLVEGLSDEFKYALVAGAVTGGGLTVIANAPNPAGMAILRKHFEDGAVNAGGLFLAALGPTVVAMIAFKLL
ncbi:MAG: putative Na+/H+ antiporter [Burkholderiales bacterium]|nr:putative Na+/H+ antiporter [Burkholderiales bacterium]